MKVENPIINILSRTSEDAFSVFKLLFMLKQDEEEFYAMVRRDFQKRLRITYFEDDGSGELVYELRYKHWYYILFYLFFRGRRHNLSGSAIIIAEEYLFKLTDRKIKKGHTDFLIMG